MEWIHVVVDTTSGTGTGADPVGAKLKELTDAGWEIIEVARSSSTARFDVIARRGGAA